MYRYKVTDPSGVYETQYVEVPFSIDPTKQAQYVVMANHATVLAIAIERMCGSPIVDIDPADVRNLFERLEYENFDEDKDLHFLSAGRWRRYL